MSILISFQHRKYLESSHKHPLRGALIYSCSKERIYKGIENMDKSSLFEDL